MATRRSSSSGRGVGGIVYGVLAGLLIGLMIAATVAYYLKKSPLPFVDKVSRSPEKTTPAGPATGMPDPNAAFGSQPERNPDAPPLDVPKVVEPTGGVTPAPTTPGSPSSTTAAPAVPAVPTTTPPPTAQSNPSTTGPSATTKPAPPEDKIGALIANLSPGQQAPNRTAGTSSTKNDAPKADGAKPADSGPSSGAATYYLQVGSFKDMKEAETLRAKLIMTGVSSEIQHAEVGGNQVHRVRVGPFVGIDEMNKVRTHLSQEKIPAVIVKQ